MKQKILALHEIAKGKFLMLREILYSDHLDRLRHWETVDRCGETSAVFILARIMPDNELVLVRQFRPPTGKLILEFPAGLIDPGETVAQAALRELYEETGYHGRILSVTAPGYSSAGLSGETISMATIEIDGNAYRQQKPTPHPEDSECIECVRVPFAQLHEFVKTQEAENIGIDSKIYTLIYTMNLQIDRKLTLEP